MFSCSCRVNWSSRGRFCIPQEMMSILQIDRANISHLRICIILIDSPEVAVMQISLILWTPDSITPIGEIGEGCMDFAVNLSHSLFFFVPWSLLQGGSTSIVIVIINFIGQGFLTKSTLHGQTVLVMCLPQLCTWWSSLTQEAPDLSTYPDFRSSDPLNKIFGARSSQGK